MSKFKVFVAIMDPDSEYTYVNFTQDIDRINDWRLKNRIKRGIHKAKEKRLERLLAENAKKKKAHALEMLDDLRMPYGKGKN